MPYGLRQFLKAAAALAGALLSALFVYLMHSSTFAGGESTYYLYSASSQAEIRSTLSLADLAHLKGESAVYVGVQSETGESAEEVVKRITAAYRAEICFVEEIGGTASFYCYSGDLKDGVILNGKKVNLHIAVRADSVAVGTPIIFGGY